MRRDKPIVLLVDNEPDYLDLVGRILEAEGCRVVTAGDAREALAAAAAHSLDLAVLDVNLPDLDGYALCREIRLASDHEDLPVLFLSVRDGMKDIIRGIAAGGRDFLTKPVRRQELVTAVGRALVAA